MATPAFARDPVDGTIFYECGCDSTTTFYNQETGEFQCVVNCEDGHSAAYSQADGRFSCICPAVS